MKREKLSVKKTILKKIDFRHKQLKFITTKGEKKMDDMDRLRIYGNTKPQVFDVKPAVTENILYNKKISVDYDVVVCIPSHNRYIKIRRLLQQIYNQKTKYSFKIILLDDGSIDSRYNKLKKEFPDVTYLKNEKANGKALHWYCYNQMWGCVKNVTCHTILQMDDDFILCDNFLNTMVDLFFIEKEKNGKVMAIAPHLWSFKLVSGGEDWWTDNKSLDGIALLDDAVLKEMNYEMKPVDIKLLSKPGQHVRTWLQIKESIARLGGLVYRTADSLVYHDGNEDSKLHCDARINGNLYIHTQRFIGDTNLKFK